MGDSKLGSVNCVHMCIHVRVSVYTYFQSCNFDATQNIRIRHHDHACILNAFIVPDNLSMSEAYTAIEHFIVMTIEVRFRARSFYDHDLFC